MTFSRRAIEQYMGYAYRAARTSPDPSTQNGAVVVHPFQLSAPAQPNTWVCREHKDLLRLRDRKEKYLYIEHAERLAIAAAHTQGVSTYGASLFALWAACPDCARAIITAGIRDVYTHAFYRENPNPRWDLTVPDEMLAEAGVRLHIVDFDVMGGGDPVLFNGQPVRF